MATNDGKPEIISLQKTYFVLTKELYEASPSVYNKLLMLIKISIFKAECYRVTKVYKPRKNGTAMTLVPIRDLETYESELDKLIQEAKELDIKLNK